MKTAYIHILLKQHSVVHTFSNDSSHYISNKKISKINVLLHTLEVGLQVKWYIPQYNFTEIQVITYISCW